MTTSNNDNNNSLNLYYNYDDSYDGYDYLHTYLPNNLHNTVGLIGKNNTNKFLIQIKFNFSIYFSE